MFDNIQGAVMTPEQYVQFVRATWALIGLSPGGAPRPPEPTPPPAAGGAR
jgi:hypothetical protein